MGKKFKTRRFVTVRNIRSGREWQYVVPDRIGKVKVGDIVVVGAGGGSFALGEVISKDPCAEHRNANIWPIVDKVDIKSWKKGLAKAARRSQLLDDMACRQARLDALGRYKASAKDDKAMKRMLAEYDTLA